MGGVVNHQAIPAAFSAAVGPLRFLSLPSTLGGRPVRAAVHGLGAYASFQRNELLTAVRLVPERAEFNPKGGARRSIHRRTYA